MASAFAALAVEIIELIAEASDPADLISLRLVCKGLYRKTLHCFGQKFFTTVRTDLSCSSLQKLQNIAEEEPLRHHVQTLLIKRSPTQSGRWFHDPEQDLRWRRHPSGYLEIQDSEFRLLRRVLVEGLVNCRSFNVHGHDDVDGLYESNRLTPSDAVGIILAIVADTSLPVKSFSVDFSPNSTGRLDAKRLQLPLYQQPEFRSGWSHIQELLLEYSIDSNDLDWALDLVLHAPKLERLSLNFYDHSSQFINRLTKEGQLPALQSLRLTSAYVTVESISKLLMSCRDSLRELSLKFVRLEHGGAWATVLRELRSNFSLLESFSLLWLRGEDKSGGILHLMFPTLSDNPIVSGSEDASLPRSDCRLLKPLGLPINLVYKRFRKEVRVIGVNYHGRRMDAVLDILAESAEVL
ncbi:MAG: hypothetical protein M1837_000310 [Sclerophora amabilis]|nr:MAG: hypothetical protein M1837_000310 [Sclerophora amabilis]